MIDVIVESGAWDEAALTSLAERATDATLHHLGLNPWAFEIALLACDDARITELNADFRDKPTPTNVLSWPSAERAAQTPGGVPLPPEDEELGDIALAYQTCAAEAKAQSKAFETHVAHLVVHGTLHLLGYDHINDEDAALMEGIERDILARLGLPDPYGEEAAR